MQDNVNIRYAMNGQTNKNEQNEPCVCVSTLPKGKKILSFNSKVAIMCIILTTS